MNSKFDNKSRIFFGGDLAPVTIGENLRLSNSIKCWISDHEFGVVNLEAPLSMKAFYPFEQNKIVLRMEPKLIEVLRSLNIGGVCLANNHIFDCGIEGFDDTCTLLKKCGIGHFGAGRNIDDATRPWRMEIADVDCAFLGFCSPYTSPIFCATKNTPGVALLDREIAETSICRLRKEVEFICVLVHWGEEYHTMPSPYQVQWFNIMRRAGADLIVGHHSHVIQPDAIVDKCWVSFGLGNMIFDDVYLPNRTRPVVKQTNQSRLGKLLSITPGLPIQEAIRVEIVYSESGELSLSKEIANSNDTRKMGHKLERHGFHRWLAFRTRYINIMKAFKFILRPSNLTSLYRLRKHHLKYVFKLLFKGNRG